MPPVLRAEARTMTAIDRRIANVYTTTRVANFYADRFAGKTLTLDEATAALRALAATGRLEIRAHAYCDDGHCCWGGTEADLAQAMKDGERFVCQECDLEFDGVDMTQTIHFAMSEEWRAELDATHTKPATPRLTNTIEEQRVMKKYGLRLAADLIDLRVNVWQSQGRRSRSAHRTERTVALRKLLESKDAAVRAGLAKP